MVWSSNGPPDTEDRPAARRPSGGMPGGDGAGTTAQTAAVHSPSLTPVTLRRKRESFDSGAGQLGEGSVLSTGAAVDGATDGASVTGGRAAIAAPASATSSVSMS
jgi:hypothetical protein